MEEVEHRDLQGKLFYVKYYIVDNATADLSALNDQSPYIVNCHATS